MKIPEMFVAKVRDYLRFPHNRQLKRVLLEMIDDMEGEEVDREALREMVVEIEMGAITLGEEE